MPSTVTGTDTSFRERVRRFLEGAIFCGVLTLIALTAVPYGTVDAWWESIFESATFILAILWILEGTLGGSGVVREHRLLLPLFALVVFALIQSLPLGKTAGGPALEGALVNRAISVDPFETWRFVLKLSAITLTLGLLLRYVSSFTRLRVLAFVVIGIALVSALFGLFSVGMPRSVWDPTWSRRMSGQSFGQFENRNHFAFLMEMGIGLVLGLVVSEWRAQRKRLALYVLLALTLWSALLLTHSRGGVLSLLLEILFFFFLYGRFRTSSDSLKNNRAAARKRPFLLAKRVALATFLLAAVAASVVLIGGDETISRLESTPDEFAARIGRPRNLRPQIWRGTLELIKDNQPLGVGFAGYSVAIPRYLRSSGGVGLQQAHNDYLEVLASGGVIGGALVAWFVWAFARFARQRPRSDLRAARALKCGALAGLLAVAVHSLFDFGLHITVNALVCSALVVVAIKSSGDDSVVSRQGSPATS